jgi:hypothetical protein
MKYILAAALALPLALGGCAEFYTTAQSYQDKIAGACAVAMSRSSVAGPIGPWIIGGCATEAAIAKLALDPSSLAWLNSLVAKAKGA